MKEQEFLKQLEEQGFKSKTSDRIINYLETTDLSEEGKKAIIERIESQKIFIEIGIYYAVDDKGEVLLDEESMQEEFEIGLRDLKEILEE